MKEIVFGIICNIIVAFLTWIITKTYHGYKSFKGIKHAARFNNDCFKAGIINVFQRGKHMANIKSMVHLVNIFLEPSIVFYMLVIG